MHRIHSAYLLAFLLIGIVAAPAGAQTVNAPTPLMGGSAFGDATNPADAMVVAGEEGRILTNGKAAAPAGAPQAVKDAIAAANEIIGRPYIYGGGHKSFTSRGYDCSGTVSYALHGGSLLDDPLDSSSFLSWGESGRGSWITVYTNPGHAFMVIAGLRLDTSAAGDKTGAKGPRWRPRLRSTSGFKARHPDGF